MMSHTHRSTPKSLSRPRLLPGLALRAGDAIAGRTRVVSLLRADRACGHFAAVQEMSNTPVEVQLLLAMDDSIEPIHFRFLSDARRAASLKSEAIQRILQVGVTSDGHPFVVREASRGEVLADLLKKVGSLSTEDAVDVALAVCEALDTAHAYGVIHGDIDASSIRLEWSQRGPAHVKVTGLGTSRALAMLPHDGRSFASSACRAPELRSDEEIDGRADIWGVGALLYTMLVGAPPFAASPSTMNIAAVLDEPSLLAGVPDDLADIVDSCLARDPAQRPQTAAFLASKLGRFGTYPVVQKRALVLVEDSDVGGRATADQVSNDVSPRSKFAGEFVTVADVTPIPTVVTYARERVAPGMDRSSAANLQPVPALRKARASRPLLVLALGGAALAALLVGVFVSRASHPSFAKVDGAEGSRVAASVFVAPEAAELLSAPKAPEVSAPVASPSAEAPVQAVRTIPPAPVAVQPPRASRPLSPPLPRKPKASDDDLRRFLEDRR